MKPDKAARFADADSPKPATTAETEELGRPKINLDSVEKRVRELEAMVQRHDLELASTHELSNQQALEAVEILSWQMKFLRFERMVLGKNPLPTNVNELKGKIARFQSKAKCKPEKEVEEAPKEGDASDGQPGTAS